MKLIINEKLSILIREEDFLEITIGEQDIVYVRRDGSRATIKLPRAAISGSSNNSEKLIVQKKVEESTQGPRRQAMEVNTRIVKKSKEKEVAIAEEAKDWEAKF